MQRLLGSKIMMIAALIIFFLIGFSFIGAMIYERKQSYQQVVKDIARDNVNPQTVLTPFIVVPMTTSSICADDKSKSCYKRQQIVITPEKSTWTNKVKVDDQRYKRGIYNAISYQNQMTLTGRFTVSDTLLHPSPNQVIDWDNAKMRFYLSDLRGLKKQPTLILGEKKIDFAFPKEEGVNPLHMAYTHTAINFLQQTPSFDFTLEVDLAGTGSFQALPLGNDLAMTMEANWPHPSFYGESLPVKQLTSKDFNANWQNTFLSNRNTQLLTACMANNTDACTQLQAAFQRQPVIGNNGSRAQATSMEAVGGFGVNFIQAVNVYLMTERAIKYALLFLVITFGTFFLFEILKGLAIHPMQYTLVGAALAVFYLLLLSFSEHIAFRVAYLIAGTACVSLITFYVSYVLKSVLRSLVFGVLLIAMYSTLFVILQSEDFTLILGSILVFVLIAVMMFLTRHVDWYRLKVSEAE